MNAFCGQSTKNMRHDKVRLIRSRSIVGPSQPSVSIGLQILKEVEIKFREKLDQIPDFLKNEHENRLHAPS